MNKKIMPKGLLDKLIAHIRRYHSSEINPDTDEYRELLDGRLPLAQKLAKECGAGWLPLLDLMDSIFSCEGLCRDAEPETVYQVLEVLGWQVIAE